MDIKYSPTHHYLCQEAMLCKSTLLSGFDNLLKSNFDPYRTGYFYTSLFLISTGIERFLKTLTIVSHMNKNNFTPPTEKYLRSFSHNLIQLDEHCSSLNQQRISHTEKNQEVLSLFSDFASGSRYFNLTAITAKPKADPLHDLQRIVLSLGHSDISGKKIEAMQTLCFSSADRAMGAGGSFYTSKLDHNNQVMSIVDEMYLMRLYEAVAPHIVWRIIQILQPHFETLKQQISEAHKKEEHQSKTPAIPYLDEFFPFLYADKTTAIKRKRWAGIYD